MSDVSALQLLNRRYTPRLKATRYIFRSSHGHAKNMWETNTVDGRIHTTAFVKMIKLYSMLILNAEPDGVLPQVTMPKCAYPYGQ
jgi:hypothetical protein